MNEELIYGFIFAPETYCKYIHVPLTKIERRKIALARIKDFAIEALWDIAFTAGIMLQVGGLAYLAGIMFKIGSM